MNDHDLVKKCLTMVCARLGMEPSQMTQRDFELLSGEIENKTDTLISVSTLRRLLHGEFSRLPQAATLNAISGYLGYKNWHEYRTSEKSNQPVSEALAAEPKTTGNLVRYAQRRWQGRWKIIGASVFGVGILATVGFLTISKKVSNTEQASFSVRKMVANGIPNTVVFNYNIDDVDADSFFIQQSWDERRRFRIYKKNYTITDIYYEPGYHIAKLIANDKVIQTFDVSIPTSDWFFFAKRVDNKNNPEYIKTARYIHDGKLTLTQEDLDLNHVDQEVEKIYIYSLFPDKMEVSTDNFTMKARVRVKQIRNDFCPHLMCEIFSQKHFYFFKSTAPGCVSEEMVGFGENFVSGKTSDLSSIALDITQWTDIEVRVRDKHVTVFFNNNKVYSSSYTQSSGFITGLAFISNGLCEIDHVEVKGVDGKIVYSNSFNEDHISQSKTQEVNNE